jgi:hypothetical protein
MGTLSAATWSKLELFRGTAPVRWGQVCGAVAAQAGAGCQTTMTAAKSESFRLPDAIFDAAYGRLDGRSGRGRRVSA